MCLEDILLRLAFRVVAQVLQCLRRAGQRTLQRLALHALIRGKLRHLQGALSHLHHLPKGRTRRSTDTAQQLRRHLLRLNHRRYDRHRSHGLTAAIRQ
ncbi:hypothetical protein D3C80_1536740 [compost metagenome]